MSKPKTQQKQRAEWRGNETHDRLLNSLVEREGQPIREKIDRSPIEGLTENQRRYINAINTFTLTFATGPAGTGKTWIAAAMAAEALDKKQTQKIIITRPAVEAGENLGFLPGDMNEKFDPYLAPFKEVLIERFGKAKTEYLIKTGRIEAAPLAYMRGRTFKESFVILDEAQNTTPNQMKMFLTRIGHDCKVVVNGDIAQTDIRGVCGLEDAVKRLAFIPSIKSIEFTRADVVRSGLVQEILESYDRKIE